MLIGFALAASGFALSAFMPTGRLFFAAVLIAVLGNIANAPQSSIMSRLVGPQDQGLLSGATNAIRSLTGIFGPVLFTAFFAQSIRFGGAALSGLAFVVAALLYAGSGALCAWITRAPQRVVAEMD
jgi:DHA1 family tetracycline resistance protein-like MFS transporter